jgi:Holliday junction DNA helicase RuvA
VIARLTGRLAECTPEQVLLDVGGVGYQVLIPLSTYYGISGRTDQPVSLFVHTHVREDALLLFGFGNREERAAFELLIGISGVGPRMALAILSGIGVDELHVAVREQDRARLQQIPGVGKKTAERLLLELRDKLERIAPHAAAAQAASGTAAEERTGSGVLRADAESALINLGYSKERAERAVNQAWKRIDGEPSLEELLKAALGRLLG